MFQIKKGGCWRLLAVLGAASQVRVAAQEVVSERDFLGEMPVVLSVSRLAQRLDDTPGAVTIIDRDWIRLSGARDVADLLRLVPGFQTTTSFEVGAPQASYHGALGSYSSQTQVLVDGRSAYSPFLVGSIALGMQSVALGDIERIEVLRGSNSAAYGARAMLGVINIVTRHTGDTQGIQVGVGAGENRVRDAQARLGWRADDASFRLSFDRRGDAGLAGAVDQNRINRLNFRADVRSAGGDELQLRAGLLAIESGIGTVGNIANPAREHATDINYLQFDWRRSLREDEDLLLSMSRTQESYTDAFMYPLQAFGIPGSFEININGHSSNDNLLLQHTFRRGPDVRVVWGGELRREQVVSKAVYFTDAPFVTEFARLFANAEWHLSPALVLNAGAMAEKSSLTGSSLAPRLMFNWHLEPVQTLRAGVSRAYRPPGTFEKFGDVRFVANGRVLRITTQSSGTVQPENMLSRELGYLGDFPALGLQTDVRVFNERMGQYIRRQNLDVRTPFLYDYVNDEDFSIYGLEYQLKWRPSRDTQIGLNQARINNTSYDKGTALSAPKLATSLTLVQKLPMGVDLSLMHQQTSLLTPQGGYGFLQGSIKRTDLRVGMPMRLGNNRAEVAAVVQNLGAPSMDFRPGFRFERRAFVNMRVEY
jgi:iron complex outermembrane recepter protein